MNKLSDPKKFITAGKSIFTIRNEDNGNRFTFRVKKCEGKDIWFVGVLTGSDNTSHYSYIGTIFGKDFCVTQRSKFKKDDIKVIAFDWFWKRIQDGKLPEKLGVYHEGRCGRCGRRLTVPESIESGFGPECITKL